MDIRWEADQAVHVTNEEWGRATEGMGDEVEVSPRRMADSRAQGRQGITQSQEEIRVEKITERCPATTRLQIWAAEWEGIRSRGEVETRGRLFTVILGCMTAGAADAARFAAILYLLAGSLLVPQIEGKQTARRVLAEAAAICLAGRQEIATLPESHSAEVSERFSRTAYAPPPPKNKGTTYKTQRSDRAVILNPLLNVPYY